VLEPPLADTLLRRVIRDSFHGLIESEDTDATLFVIRFRTGTSEGAATTTDRQPLSNRIRRVLRAFLEPMQTIGFDGADEFVSDVIEIFEFASGRTNIDIDCRSPSTNETMKTGRHLRSDFWLQIPNGTTASRR